MPCSGESEAGEGEGGELLLALPCLDAPEAQAWDDLRSVLPSSGELEAGEGEAEELLLALTCLDALEAQAWDDLRFALPSSGELEAGEGEGEGELRPALLLSDEMVAWEELVVLMLLRIFQLLRANEQATVAEEAEGDWRIWGPVSLPGPVVSGCHEKGEGGERPRKKAESSCHGVALVLSPQKSGCTGPM